MQSRAELAADIARRMISIPEHERSRFIQRESGDDEALIAMTWSLAKSAESLEANSPQHTTRSEVMDQEASSDCDSDLSTLAPTIDNPERARSDPYSTLDEAAGQPSSPSIGSGTESLGTGNSGTEANKRYVPIGLHASGGLGAVFRATDTELNRTIALKEIKEERAWDINSQNRFVFEAEVTGSLEHPGIVPVYGFGRYPDGRPFYAMKFIEGHSLQAAIKRFHREHAPLQKSSFLHRDFRRLLRNLIDACNALHYAHERDIVHRDIKPDNIMLGSYGETLVVDWGLAKHLNSDAEDKKAEISLAGRLQSDSNTIVGSALGTPQFMSPEQASGSLDDLSRRSDVYSLGGVLFSMIADSPSVEGSSGYEIVSNVQQGKINKILSTMPTAPRPLCSICDKAMRHKGSARYETALEMADELQRWLDDEQVAAHASNETFVERVGRLLRRHRSWTVSVAAALSAVTLASVIAIAFVNAARNNERIARLSAQSSRTDALNRSQQSQQAIGSWLVSGNRALKYFPGTDGLRIELLRQAETDYLELAESRSDDPDLEFQRALVIVRLGDIHRMLLDYAKAHQNYDRALGLLHSLPNNSGPSRQIQAECANVLNRKGLTYAAETRLREAEEQYRGAISLLDAPETDDLKQGYLAATNVNLAELLIRLGRTSEAIEALRISRSIYLAKHDRTAADIGIAKTHLLQGRCHQELGDLAEAANQLEAATAELLASQSALQMPPEHLETLAKIQNAHASVMRQQGNPLKQQSLLRSALQTQAMLLEVIPSAPSYQIDQITSLVNLGISLFEDDQIVLAKAQIQDAHTKIEKLFIRFGSDNEFGDTHGETFLALRATCRDVMGQVIHTGSREPNLATQFLLASVSDHEQLVEAFPSVIQHKLGLATAMSHLAQAYIASGDFDQGRKTFNESILGFENLIESNPQIPAYRNSLAHTHNELGLALFSTSKKEASEQFAAARKFWQAKTTDGNAEELHQLAWLLATCPVESMRDNKEALSIARIIDARSPDNHRYQTTLALTLIANESLDEANSVLSRIEQEKPGRHLYALAMYLSRSGNSQDAKDTIAAADEWAESKMPNSNVIQTLKRMAVAVSK